MSRTLLAFLVVCLLMAGASVYVDSVQPAPSAGDATLAELALDDRPLPPPIEVVRDLIAAQPLEAQDPCYYGYYTPSGCPCFISIGGSPPIFSMLSAEHRNAVPGYVVCTYESEDQVLVPY